MAVYPALVGGSLAAAAAALSRGLDPAAVVPAVTVVGVVLVALLERILPFEPQWQRSHEDQITDGLHLVLSLGAAGEAGRQASLWLGEQLGGSLWPTGWPVAAQLALALLVAEFGAYWLHRIQHRGGLLWRLHAVHHSAPRLYFLNAARLHPGDAFLSALVSIAPLVLLGIPPDILALWTVATGVHSALQHGNVDLRLGPLNWVLSAAEVHRWHHSRDLGEANANYGQVLLVWDLLFGTRAVPDRRPPVDTGLAGEDLPEGWLGQLLAPAQARWWS